MIGGEEPEREVRENNACLYFHFRLYLSNISIMRVWQSNRNFHNLLPVVNYFALGVFKLPSLGLKSYLAIIIIQYPLPGSYG